MRILIISTILSLLMITCKGQTIDTKITNNSKKDTMEYFNENKYKDWELQKNSSNTNKYYKKGNTWVRVIFRDREYTEEIESINSSYKEYKYYHNNNLLKSRIKEFNGFPIEIVKEYDENGKLIKETDWDKDYPFKVEDLCRLIKEEYDVDLMVKSDPNKEELQYRVDRRYDASTKQYLYFVVFSFGYSDEGEPGFPIKAVYVDGVSGKVLYEDAQFLERPNGDKIPRSKTPFPQKGEKEKRISTIYRTHNGVNYTQSEWEAYEEKQYEEYCKRTGRPYTPKDVRTSTEQESSRSPFFAQDGEKGDDSTPKKKGFWDNLFG